MLKLVKLTLAISLALETTGASLAVLKENYELAQAASMAAIVTVLSIGVIQKEEDNLDV